MREMPTDEAIRHAESLAYADYAASLGKVFLVDELTGYSDDDEFNPRHYGYFDLKLDTPARVRLVHTDEDSLKHWVDEWLDPYWNFELIEPHPQLPAKIRTMWGYGPSYNALTGERTEAPVEEYSGCVERGYY